MENLSAYRYCIAMKKGRKILKSDCGLLNDSYKYHFHNHNCF